MIAVIAGKGNLPIEACKNLAQANKSFFIVSLFSDNRALLEQFINKQIDVVSKEFYKAGEILKLLKEKKTNQVLFIGKVDKQNLLKKIKLDWLAIKLLASTTCQSDKSIMETLLSKLKKEGISTINQTDVLNSLLVKPGVLTGKLSSKTKDDIEFGMNLAHKISHENIGQTVIVKDKMALAVEAIEGTSECIKRGIQLGTKDVVICKAAHLDQNQKYDLPTLGSESLKDLQQGQVKAIAWESTKTFIADKEEFVKRAKELGITLISV